MTSDPVLRPSFHRAPAFFVSDVACRDHLADHACRYQVAWKINPHMAIGAVDFAQAAAQHAALVTALEQAGARVVRVPFVHGAYDSVFAKDSALVLERGGAHRVLLARPRHPEREREQAGRADVSRCCSVCGAERLLPHDRADLIEAFGPSVFDTYGCREVMMIAAECEVHEGMHVAVENLVVEIIVSENGIERPARDGEAGEVVITDLHNLAMPFIRYANGDVAVAGPS